MRSLAIALRIKGMLRLTPARTSRLLKKGSECFENLSMNGKSSTIPVRSS